MDSDGSECWLDVMFLSSIKNDDFEQGVKEVPLFVCAGGFGSVWFVYTFCLYTLFIQLGWRVLRLNMASAFWMIA
jgi:hypothetical protein